MDRCNSVLNPTFVYHRRPARAQSPYVLNKNNTASHWRKPGSFVAQLLEQKVINCIINICLVITKHCRVAWWLGLQRPLTTEEGQLQERAREQKKKRKRDRVSACVLVVSQQDPQQCCSDQVIMITAGGGALECVISFPAELNLVLIYRATAPWRTVPLS